MAEHPPDPQPPVPHTTAEEFISAWEIYRGNWDANGITTVYLPTAIAEQLLEARGWTHSPASGWTTPTGQSYWHADEALQIALSAEAL